MKKIVTFMLAMALSTCISGCQNQKTPQSRSNEPLQVSQKEMEQEDSVTSQEEVKNNHSILIAYFSLGENTSLPEGMDASTSASILAEGKQVYGTTGYVANMIQQNIGGDLYSIQTETPYPEDFDAVVDQNHQEVRDGILPVLVENNLDIASYDTVFIGYPIWATNAPQAIFSFLSEYDLSGKTIIPFCTHDGYGPGSSYRDIEMAIPNAATVLEGLAIEGSDVPQAEKSVSQWLQDIGMERQNKEETAITITVGDRVLEGVLYDTALANEISQYFPLTISAVNFGDREFYGSVDFYPTNWEGGQVTFENGDITYCDAHHNMAIFYAQTDNPTLSVEVTPIGKVVSDLSVFEQISGNVEITFSLAE